LSEIDIFFFDILLTNSVGQSLKTGMAKGFYIKPYLLDLILVKNSTVFMITKFTFQSLLIVYEFDLFLLPQNESLDFLSGV
jgi:hypothetical protein